MHIRRLPAASVAVVLLLAACDGSALHGEIEVADPFVRFSFSGDESGTFDTSEASAADLGARVQLTAVMDVAGANYAFATVSNRPLGTGTFEFDRGCRIIFPDLDEPPCAIGQLVISPDGAPQREYSFDGGTLTITAASTGWISGHFQGTMSNEVHGAVSISGGVFEVPVGPE